MNIIDNFLSEEEFDKLCALTIDSRYFPWFSNGDGVAYTGDLSDKYFMHTFYDKHQPNSHNFECLTPVLDKLAPKALIRARANWYTRNNKLIEHAKHPDYPFEHKAFILYLNTNDGFTRMNDGTAVNSVANRALFFNGNELHNSTNCTDALFRANIAINYL
jgi:hypothetical protein